MREYLKKIDDNRIMVEKHDRMNVDGVVYVNEDLRRIMGTDESIKQVENVASLPGIVKASMAMPDIHWGYGFPIGGVAAFDVDKGVVSPGGVGYDINCGVRLIRSVLSVQDIKKKIPEIIDRLYINVPSGVGSHRKDLRLSRDELKKVVVKGARWAVENGYGTREDLDYVEDGGRIENALPDNISDRAFERGKDQLGTLGSGNHFVEIGYVEDVYDRDAADAFGLSEGQVTIMIHTGSRGLGYQICDDYIREMFKASEKYGIYLADRQLCCAPVESPEGQKYLSAMASAANYAFANRQMITHWVRETFEGIFNMSSGKLGLSLMYDVCHNIAKIERHKIVEKGESKETTLCVHRKGATRAFPAGNPKIPQRYVSVGQPVLVPGDMGRASYVLCGTERAMNETFGSTCHGAGRMMSRSQAIKASKGRSITKELESKGIYVRAAGKATFAEEMPEAYKDVSKVVRVVHDAGISKLVAKIIPMGAIKG
jgi:tRNA-splicing ligase RtcB